jgi:hypothetical protein
MPTTEIRYRTGTVEREDTAEPLWYNLPDCDDSG